MPEIHYVTVNLTPDQIAEGYYTVEDGLLTMVYSDGEPVKLDDGSSVTHRLDDTPAQSIARALTKRIRRSLMGEKVEGFSDPITYLRTAVA